MITIDRSSHQSVQEQIIEQLRYLIASGHFRVAETLPSTRSLAERLQVSFHTVRKAYQELEREGLLVSKVGSGFVVIERKPLSAGERMERGAAIVQELLYRLIGLGLEETEIEYLIQEQLDLLTASEPEQRFVFAGVSQELSELCAAQISHAIQQHVEPVLLNRLASNQDADYAFASFADLKSIMAQLPRADAIGVTIHYTPSVLDYVGRMLGHETLGVVTRDRDAIQPLMTSIPAATHFSGQMIAATIDDTLKNASRILGESDYVIYTPACRRRLMPLLTENNKSKHSVIAPVVSQDSIELIRLTIPS